MDALTRLVATPRITSETCPPDPELFMLLGIANDMLGNFAEAQKAFRRSIELEPRAARPRTNLGVSFCGPATKQRLFGNWKAPSQSIPLNTVAHTNLAFCYTRQRKFRAGFAVV